MSGQSRRILITGGRVIDPGSGVDDIADVLVVGGAIEQVGRDLPVSDENEAFDATGMVVSPGFIDMHCHLREPGFEDKETIASGTAAAAAGGFTTVCAMPNTDPPMDNAATIDFVVQKAKEEGAIRVLPIGCVTKGSAGSELADMVEMAEAGAIGFSDDGHPVTDDHLIRQALAYSSTLDRPIIEHCEQLALTAGGHINEGWIATRLGVRGIPSVAEEQMAARDIALAELTGGWIHLAHVSTTETVDLVRRAKERDVRVTAEVTPHHLTLTEQAVLGLPGGGSPFDPLTPHAYNTHAKVNPPLRTDEDVQSMVAALAEGVIDVIATDHAPHSASDKLCTLDEAAFGISGLETALGAAMTLVNRGAVSLSRILETLTVSPARLLGDRVPRGLGTLANGAPADIVIFDPEAEWVVETGAFLSKGRNTPFSGTRLAGRVVATFYDGRLVERK